MTRQNLLASALLFALPTLALAAGEQPVNVQLSGGVEVEAVSVDDAGVKSSDISVSTVELSFDAQMNEHVSGHVLLLHEEGDTPLELDEATITAHLNGEHSSYITVGQSYIPFGRFETQMVSDPLTLDIGEARETVFQLSFKNNGLLANVYAYNGAINEVGSDDNVANYGANLGYVMERSGYNFDLGVSYISNIAEAFGLMDVLPDADDDGETDPIDSFVSGTSAFAIISHGAFKTIFEVVRSSRFDATSLAYKGEGAAPCAWNAEIGYALDGKSTLSVGLQGTKESSSVGLLESKQLIAYSREVMDATTLAVEFAQGDYYSVEDGGDGDDYRAFTTRLAVSF